MINISVLNKSVTINGQTVQKGDLRVTADTYSRLNSKPYYRVIFKIKNGSTIRGGLDDVNINGQTFTSVQSLRTALDQLFFSCEGGGSGDGAVSSVNGQVGDVVLTPQGIGALPVSYTPPNQSWGQVQGKPTTFPPSTHTHPMDQVTGLSTALSGKANTVHTHNISDVVNLETTLNQKLSNITGLIEEGSNVTISGAGTSANPYVIHSTGGGEGTGAVDSVNGLTGEVVITAEDIGAATQGQGVLAESAVQPEDLGELATKDQVVWSTDIQDIPTLLNQLPTDIGQANYVLRSDGTGLIWSLVGTGSIANGSIINEDINANASIALTKLAMTSIGRTIGAAANAEAVNAALGLQQWFGTQAQYDAITTKDPSINYFIQAE